MNRKHLFFLIFIPSLVGYIYNLILLVPLLGTLAMYIFPALMLACWYWTGSKFAESGIGMVKSSLLGNSLGIISILIYIWQFVLVNDENRNLFLAGLSQMFTACTNLLTVRFAILFEPEKNVFGRASFIAMQISGLVLMVIVFGLGFYIKKSKANKVI